MWPSAFWCPNPRVAPTILIRELQMEPNKHKYIPHRKFARTEVQAWHLRGSWQNQGWPTGGRQPKTAVRFVYLSCHCCPIMAQIAGKAVSSLFSGWFPPNRSDKRKGRLKPTSASENRNVRLFTLKIKNISKTSVAYRYTEMSEVWIQHGKASPSTYIEAGSAASASLSELLQSGL